MFISTTTLLSVLTMFAMSAMSATHLQAMQIDRYTSINNIETQQQRDELSVIINIKFPAHITTVKAAINHLLLRSSYELDLNYEADRLSLFRLPFVQRHLGPISLKRAISVLIGDTWDLEIDKLNRQIRITIKDEYKTPDQALSIKSNVANEWIEQVVKVNIKQGDITSVLDKILPNVWKHDIDTELLPIKISVISEDKTRFEILQEIVNQIGAQASYLPKMKVLVIRKIQYKESTDKIITNDE